MNLMIGAPVYRREWCLEPWFQHVYRALEVAGISDFSFAFVGDPKDPSFEIINEHGREQRIYVRRYNEPDIQERERTWNPARYHKMVELRNSLLEVPQQYKPDYFLSLDTDILLHEECITNLIESIERFDAVAGKAFLTPRGTFHPTYAMLTKDNNLKRSDSTGVIQVDVIMAIKLLTLNAYNTPYKFHAQGEDIGFSLNCRKRGMVLGFDGRVTNKHLMSKEDLEKVDIRCGW